MSVKLIQTETERYYSTPSGNLPSVNAVLRATKPEEEKQRLAIASKKRLEKQIRALRMCRNCLYYTGKECVTTQGKLRADVNKKNRCKWFKLPGQKLEAIRNDGRNFALNRGTAVHAKIEAYLNGGEMPDDYYVKQIWYFLQTIRPHVLYVEKPLFMPGAAGTADCICGDRLFDWTVTGSKYPKREWYEDKLTQCAAYAMMCRHMGLCEPDHLAVKVMGDSGKCLDVYGTYSVYADKWKRRLDLYWAEHAMG